MTMPKTGEAALFDDGLLGERTVTRRTATAIAVADMIGTGVFTSLGFQLLAVPSLFSILALWIVGGIVALCGALSYAELAAAFPRSGGEYNYLSRIYHPALGFMAGWVSATVGFAAPVALAAMAFGGYFEGVFPGVSALYLGLAVTWAVSLVHLWGVKEGSLFQDISTLIKLGLVCALIVAGVMTANPQPISFAPSFDDIGTISGAPFALSLVYVLYSYSGWNAATYIAGEIQEPQRNLPQSILTAVLMVVVLYVVLNAVFLYTTPASEMRGQIDVALVAGRYIFGDAGGRIVGGLICVGLISSISAMTWVGPRVTMVMGQDIPLLRAFARVNKAGVPALAVLVQLAVVNVLLLTQSFETVLNFIQFALTLSSFLTVFGVIVLRWTHPNLPRPYRLWAFPLTPFVFLGVTLFVMVHMIVDRPDQSLASLATMFTGFLIYFVSNRYEKSRQHWKG